MAKVIKMRVVFLIPQSLDSPGGAGRFLPLAKALFKQGNDVKIIALHHDFSNARAKKFGIDGVEVEYVGQMQVKKVGSEKIYFRTWQLLWILLISTIRMTISVLKTDADVVQVCKAQPMNILAAWFKHTLHKTPVFLDTDDYETLNNRFKHSWQRRVVAWFELWVATFCSGITASNSFLYQLYQKAGFPEERLRLVPHGYDVERFSILDQDRVTERVEKIRHQLSVPNSYKVIVFVGSVSLISHAIDLLLTAFQGLVETHDDIILLIVGGGEDFLSLKSLVESLEIKDKIRFIGKVERDEVPLYFRLADVSVDPKRNNPLESTTLSLKIVESIAAEVPCISADIGDSSIILGEAGTMVKPGDSDDMRKALSTLLSSPETIEKMKRAARELKPHYTWDHHAVVFQNLYQMAS